MENRERKESTISYVFGTKKGRMILSAVLSFAFVLALPSMFSASGDRLWYTNSIFSLLLWLLVFGYLSRVLAHEFVGRKRRWLIPGLFGFVFSTCMVFGAELEAKESVTFTNGFMWLSILVLSVFFGITVRYFWDCFLTGKETEADTKEKQKYAKRVKVADKKGIENKEDEIVKKEKSKNTDVILCKKNFWIRTGIILLCYLPVFLAVYPGFFVYDAQDELLQVITRNFSTHHPLMHVLFMGGIIQLVYKISGSYNMGIACYTLIQMIILSGIFSYVIGLLQKEGMKKKYRAALTLYFGLCPVIVMFSLCSAKDGLFMGMLLLQVMMLRELVADAENFFQKKGHAVLLVLSSLGMMLLRHNGFYAFAVFAVILFGLNLFVLKKKVSTGNRWKKTLLLFAGVLVGYMAVNQGLTLVLNADASENQELLTVPIQQMARVHQMDASSLSEEDKNTLYEVLPEEVLARYTPKVSDGVKIDFNNEAYSRNPSRYLKLWLKLGLEHPFTYLNAWFMTSYGFWYPDTVIDVYRGNSVFTFTYEDSSYFGYEVEQPGERESKLPALNELYRKLSLEITQQKVPVLSMLFSPGFLFWVMAFFLCFLWYAGAVLKMVPYLLPLLIWMTFLLGPTYLVRYVVYLWCILPVLLFDVKEALMARFDN